MDNGELAALRLQTNYHVKTANINQSVPSRISDLCAKIRCKPFSKVRIIHVTNNENEFKSKRKFAHFRLDEQNLSIAGIIGRLHLPTVKPDPEPDTANILSNMRFCSLE